MKKLSALILAVVMVFACIGAVSAAEIADLDCPGWWAAHTDGVEVTDKGVTITFTNTTYESATENWNGPLWVLYGGDEAKVGCSNYAEYWVERGDAFGWAGGAGNAAETTTSTGAVAWDNFLSNLKAGAKATVTAIRNGDKVTVAMEISGVTSIVTTPVAADAPVYISLTGELTKLTNIKVSEGYTDLMAKVSVGSSVDCNGWWHAHSGGIEITSKGVEVTFTNTTYASAVNSWEAAVYVLYSGDTNKIGTTNYSEYWVQRADGYGWNGAVNTNDAAAMEAAGITYTGLAEDYDWENHLTNLKAGVSYTIKATRDGDKVTVTMTGNGGSTTVTVPVTSGKPVYLSLTGENTKLTGIKDASASTSGGSATSGNPAPVTPNGNDSAKTGDMGIILPLVLMASSAGAILTMKKKYNA